jgi:deoxyribose-phosphate aldolase
MIYKYNDFINENKQNNFNHIIDYTFLKTNATIDDIKKVCEDAEEKNYYTVCVRPENVATAKAFLEENDVLVCTVVSFPNGDDSTNAKLKETLKTISDGADEIDMVMNYKQLKELSIKQDEEYTEIYDEILDDVKQIARLCHSEGVLLKVIIEVEELNFNEIKIACEICTEAGADFVKTSTGFSKMNKPFSDKLEKIKYMRKILPDYMKIKVSGGIRNKEQIDSVLPYVDRIGTSIIL